MALHRNSLYFLSDRSHLYALPVTAAYPISSIEQFRDRLSSKIMLYLIPIVSIPIFLLAAVGFFVTWRRKRKQLILIYLIIALTILQNIAFYGSPRYRAPIEPLLILLSEVCSGGCWVLKILAEHGDISDPGKRVCKKLLNIYRLLQSQMKRERKSPLRPYIAPNK